MIDSQDRIEQLEKRVAELEAVVHKHPNVITVTLPDRYPWTTAVLGGLPVHPSMGYEPDYGGEG